MIDSQVEFILFWCNNCALADMTERAARNNNNSPAIVTTGLEFQITYTKLHVPVVTFSKQNDEKLLQQPKSEFKRTVKWNKYRSQMTVQSNNNNLN